MALLSGIYDSAPIQPVARIEEKLGIWSENKWLYYNIAFIEPIPRGSPFMVDMVAASGAVAIPALGAIAKQVVAFLQMNTGDLLHLRWEPIDDVEGLLWELSGQSRFSPRGAHARVTPFTVIRDPYLATTTFFILGGQNKDMNLEVRNPNAIALPMARFVFWGFRYIVELLPAKPQNVTYLPAQGR